VQKEVRKRKGEGRRDEVEEERYWGVEDENKERRRTRNVQHSLFFMLTSQLPSQTRKVWLTETTQPVVLRPKNSTLSYSISQKFTLILFSIP
jgi:hypothetical protein